MTKWLDLAGFRIALLKIPYLPLEWLNFVSIVLPGVELLTGVLLFIPVTRFSGRLLGFFLLTLFTLHLIILHWTTATVPCSCGGILESLTFPQHLVLNCILIGCLMFAEWSGYQSGTETA